MGDAGYFDTEGRLWYCGRKSQRVITGSTGNNTVLFADHHPVEPWLDQEDYHLTTDLADRALELITGHESTAPDPSLVIVYEELEATS